MGTKISITLTQEGLIAGERYLREHCDEYDDGTGEGFHIRFIQKLVEQVFHASDIDIHIDEKPREEHQENSEPTEPNILWIPVFLCRDRED